jgi:hypothetical protein
MVDKVKQIQYKKLSEIRIYEALSEKSSYAFAEKKAFFDTADNFGGY